jgi:5-methylcytosine-specific restriction endonuclease McrA
MPWATSDRRSRLPRNWQQIRATVRARAHGKCEAEKHDPRCDGIGTDCDHIIPGDDHRIEALMWLSAPCHTAKTAAETAARNTSQAALKLRPTEPHPGRRAS